MSYYVCVRCWRALQERDVLFECPDCVARGNLRGYANVPARRQRVSNLYRFGDFFRDPNQRLQCRNKHNNLRFFCECTQELLANSKVEGNNKHRLALRVVGAPGSGKTIYIAMVYHAIVHLDTIGLMGLGDTDIRCNQLVRLLTNRQRPTPTPPAERDRHRYAWKIILDGGRQAASYPILMVQDTAGETWRDLTRGPRSEELDRYLRHPGDLFFVVDGARMLRDLRIELAEPDQWDNPNLEGDDGELDRIIFGNIYNYLEASIKDMRLAIVITKADVLTNAIPGFPNLEESQQDEAIQQEFRHLLTKTGRGLLVGLGRRFKETRIFAVSSLGFCPNHTEVCNDNGQILLAEPPMPKGITAPLLWLLNM